MLSRVRSVMNHRWHRNVQRKDGGTQIDSRSTFKSTSTIGPGDNQPLVFLLFLFVCLFFVCLFFLTKMTKNHLKNVQKYKNLLL